MASLRETKDRIGSVKSTLKITSAMKLVASSKLRKAQNAVEALRSYETAMQNILAACNPQPGYSSEQTDNRGDVCSEEYPYFDNNGNSAGKPVVVVAIASNSSLCGGFNANVVRKALAIAGRYKDVTVYSLGRKMAEAMGKAGFKSPADLNGLVAHPNYQDIAALSDELCRRHSDGTVGKILLVYNHFASTSRQEVVAEQYLPFDNTSVQAGESAGDEYILEPDSEAIAEELKPKLLRMRLYAAILDSVAAEHAARTVAMQTATDNAQNLLAELTLEYNKGRQQKITAEILDLTGGQASDRF